MDDRQVVCCPRCNSSKVRKKGFRHNRGEKVQRWICTDCDYSSSDPLFLDKDVIIENVRLAKQKQSAQDRNRIANKSFREHARLDNALSEYNKQLIKVFEKHQIPKLTHVKTKNNKAVGVIQISDTHFNEEVNLPNNKYDFEIASKRLRTYIRKAKTYLKAIGVKEVLIAMTGDLMNSDRRLDEMFAQSTNRSNATFISVQILKQLIEDVRKDFKVSLACITGNESRVKDEIGWDDYIASDNYDFTIYNILRFLYRDTDVDFILSKDATEVVVNLAGMNLLMIHGHGSIKAKHETSITQIKGRYASGRDVKIDFVISGHIHSARVGDTYGRSSSLVGANAYSEKNLNLEGRASQNIYVFYKNKTIDGIKIDLQHYDDKGYDISKELQEYAYNTKSDAKLKQGKTILKIITV
jgi:predicted phosphodiesterase